MSNKRLTNHNTSKNHGDFKPLSVKRHRDVICSIYVRKSINLCGKRQRNRIESLACITIMIYLKQILMMFMGICKRIFHEITSDNQHTYNKSYYCSNKYINTEIQENATN